MKNSLAIARPFLQLIPVLLILSCGRAPVAAPVAPAPSAETGAAAVARETAAVLAVALEGDVDPLSETEYRARGPEIRCSAFLLKDGAAEPIAGVVEWRTNPADAGVFSVGANGVFFIAEHRGPIEIEATYALEGVTYRSPRLVLDATEAG